MEDRRESEDERNKKKPTAIHTKQITVHNFEEGKSQKKTLKRISLVVPKKKMQYTRPIPFSTPSIPPPQKKSQ